MEKLATQIFSKNPKKTEFSRFFSQKHRWEFCWTATEIESITKQSFVVKFVQTLTTLKLRVPEKQQP